MNDTSPEEPKTGLTTAQIEAVMTMTQVMAETTVGYHKKLLDGGINPEVASQMTKDFHDMIIAQARGAGAATAVGAQIGRRGQRR